ncbi:Diguanylate cyclase with PAS sensor [Operophtera brumata]|uniref:Diguanylate cyclase with PAS sensor n=1 Tax=Operophtera brumata TaxID=104452 RepID=A0A0L7L6F7_OPEBR|nr:Diguanylate cyclase with PAS sensor [Operophtera brumata]
MDQSMDNSLSNKCYKCEEKLLDNLNIEFNSWNSIVVLWNKYQIFIYENYKFESAAKVFIPDYQIHRLLVTNNYLLCLDINGFVHLSTLKFKNSAQKLMKCTFQPRDQGIKACVNYSEDHSLSLKYESEAYFLSLNKICSNFQEVKKVELHYRDTWLLEDNAKDKYFLTHWKIPENYFGIFQKMFNIDKLSSHHLIVLTFDRFTVYGCLFDSEVEEKTNLLKLYSCPSEICSIEIIGTDNSYMIIGLKMDIAHLNTALYKLVIANNTFMYTDGVTTWKAENVFSENISFKQFYIKNVNDFLQCGDQLICTTFNQLIYVCCQDEQSYLKPVIKEYTSAQELLNNSEYLNKVFHEVEKGKELAKKLSVEEAYLAAMSLSKRQEIMDNVIHSAVSVSSSFLEVMKENKEELTLTEDISQYFQPGLLVITVRIKCNAQGRLLDIISDIMANSDVKLQVILSNEHKILKQTSMKMSKENYLIPLQLQHSTEINVHIRLITIIPGTYDKKQKIWTELYNKNIKLTSEHFIRANVQKSLVCQKQPIDDLEMSILKFTNQYGSQFELTDISKHTSYSMYVRLPQKFDPCHFNRCTSEFMKQMLSSQEFLQSESQINFMVGKEVVSVVLVNDGFSKNRKLTITSGNLKITSNIRNFFSDIVYRDNPCKPGEEFIDNSFYTSVENLQKVVKQCITTSSSFEVFLVLMEQFEEQVIAMIPV